MEAMTEKLTEEIKFRCTPSLQEKVTKLCRRSKWKAADVIRTGVELHWPDIEAHVLLQAGKNVPITPDVRRAVVTLVRLGGDPVKALKHAAKMHLAKDSMPIAG